MEYGANRIPRRYEPPTGTILYKNGDDYNGSISVPRSLLGISAYDFDADNPSRDLVFPTGVTELKVVLYIPTTVEVKANSAVHFAEEALFSGR